MHHVILNRKVHESLSVAKIFTIQVFLYVSCKFVKTLEDHNS